MWDSDMKKTKQKFRRKKTGCIYSLGYQYCEAEGHLKLRSCLYDAGINSTPRIGKYINKIEL